MAVLLQSDETTVKLRREIKKLIGKTAMKGYTLVPLSLYFNHKNIAKISLGICKGKKMHDKRESQKRKDWDREKQQILKNKNNLI